MSDTNSTSWWNWGTGVISSVKQASEQIYNVYKDDLSQFQTTVVEDTKKLIAENKELLDRNGAAVITNKLAEGVTTGISKITSGIANIDISNLTSYLSSTQTQESDLAIRIKKLQQDPQTYDQVPDDPTFVAWKTKFDWSTKKEETQQILASNKEIMELYTQLVPSIISPQEFWERYYYRLKVAQDEFQKREALLKRATVQATSVNELTWDDFDDEKQAGGPSGTQQVDETTAVPDAPSTTVNTDDAANVDVDTTAVINNESMVKGLGGGVEEAQPVKLDGEGVSEEREGGQMKIEEAEKEGQISQVEIIPKKKKSKVLLSLQ